MIIDSTASLATPQPPPAGRGVAASQVAPPAAEVRGVKDEVVHSPDGDARSLASKNAKPKAEEVRQAVEAAREHIQQVNRDLHMSVDKDTGELVIKVVDQQSQKVIRQIPSEEVLDFIRQFSAGIEAQKGMLLKEQA